MRNIGSGNIGATNVLRTGHKGLAAATLLLDVLKGTVAVLLVDDVAKRYVRLRRLSARLSSPASAPSSAISSRSGCASRAARASPPTSACCSALHWPAALVFCLVWIAVAVSTRYSSLAALVGTVAVVLYYLRSPARRACLFILIMALLIFAKHHANIRRLLAGEESKIGARSSAQSAAKS